MLTKICSGKSLTKQLTFYEDDVLFLLSRIKFLSESCVIIDVDHQGTMSRDWFYVKSTIQGLQKSSILGICSTVAWRNKKLSTPWPQPGSTKSSNSLAHANMYSERL
jgi:hypothetical protein